MVRPRICENGGSLTFKEPVKLGSCNAKRSPSGRRKCRCDYRAVCCLEMVVPEAGELDLAVGKFMNTTLVVDEISEEVDPVTR